MCWQNIHCCEQQLFQTCCPLALIHAYEDLFDCRLSFTAASTCLINSSAVKLGKPSQLLITFPFSSIKIVNGKEPLPLYLSASSSFCFTCCLVSDFLSLGKSAFIQTRFLAAYCEKASV